MPKSLPVLIALFFLAITGCKKKEEVQLVDTTPKQDLILFQTTQAWQSTVDKETVYIVGADNLTKYTMTKPTSKSGTGCYVANKFQLTGTSIGTLTYTGVVDGQLVKLEYTPRIKDEGIMDLNLMMTTSQGIVSNLDVLQKAVAAKVADLKAGIMCDPGDPSKQKPAVEKFLTGNWETIGSGFYAYVEGNKLTRYLREANGCFRKTEWTIKTKETRTITYESADQSAIVLTITEGMDETMIVLKDDKGGYYFMQKTTHNASNIPTCEGPEEPGGDIGDDVIAAFQANAWESLDGKHFFFAANNKLVQYIENGTCYITLSESRLGPPTGGTLIYNEGINFVMVTPTKVNSTTLNLSIVSDRGEEPGADEVKVKKSTKDISYFTGKSCVIKPNEPAVTQFLGSSWKTVRNEVWFFQTSSGLTEYYPAGQSECHGVRKWVLDKEYPTYITYKGYDQNPHEDGFQTLKLTPTAGTSSITVTYQRIKRENNQKENSELLMFRTSETPATYKPCLFD